MHNRDARTTNRTTACRTETGSMHACVGSGNAEHAGDAPKEIRTALTLSRERKAVARDFDDALDECDVANTTLAEGWYETTESVVRRLRTGEKPLGLFHLAIGPRDVFARVLVRAVVRAMGTNGAFAFFAECTGLVSKAVR